MKNSFKALAANALSEFYNGFEADYSSYLDVFRRNFLEICGGISQKCDFPISVLDITMLRTNIVKQNYTAEVIAYGKEHYFDENSSTVGEIDISPVYKAYDGLYEAIVKESRKYPLTASVYDAQAYMLSICSEFYKAVSYMLRRNIYEWKDTKEFQSIPFAEDFEVNCGEYASYTDTIFIRHNTKNAMEERNRLASGENCNFADFTQLDLSGEEYEAADFRYSDFSGSSMDNCSFQGSMLDFSYLREVSAKNADFTDCVLNGSDFTKARLTGAVFDTVENEAYEEELVPFRLENRTSFRGADLRKAVFMYCDLSNVDFAEADLRETRFDKKSLETAVLTPLQRKEIFLLDW